MTQTQNTQGNKITLLTYTDPGHGDNYTLLKAFKVQEKHNCSLNAMTMKTTRQ